MLAKICILYILFLNCVDTGKLDFEISQPGFCYFDIGLWIWFNNFYGFIFSGPVHIELKLHDEKEVKSSNFPECCTKEEFLIQYVDKDKGYLRMVFDDLDFPPDSELRVTIFLSYFVFEFT